MPNWVRIGWRAPASPLRSAALPFLFHLFASTTLNIENILSHEEYVYPVKYSASSSCGPWEVTHAPLSYRPATCQLPPARLADILHRELTTNQYCRSPNKLHRRIGCRASCDELHMYARFRPERETCSPSICRSYRPLGWTL